MKHLRIVTNGEERSLVGNHLFNDNYSMIIHFNDPENLDDAPIVTKFVKEGEVPVYYQYYSSDAGEYVNATYNASLNESITNILENITKASGDMYFGSAGHLYQDDGQGNSWGFSGTTIGNSPEYDSRFNVYAEYTVQ